MELVLEMGWLELDDAMRLVLVAGDHGWLELENGLQQAEIRHGYGYDLQLHDCKLSYFLRIQELLLLPTNLGDC